MIKIYGLKCNITNMLYIGSTKNTIKERFKQHKTGNTSCVSKKIINNNDYIIYVIEECEENMRYEREQYWIDNTDNINIRRAIITKKDKSILSCKRLKKSRDYQLTWGGDKRCNNNLLLIDINLFK